MGDGVAPAVAPGTMLPLFIDLYNVSTGVGANATLLGTTSRSGGGTQLTYNGHPVYLFSKDQGPGETNGEGVNAFGVGKPRVFRGESVRVDRKCSQDASGIQQRRRRFRLQPGVAVSAHPRIGYPPQHKPRRGSRRRPGRISSRRRWR